MAYSCAVKFSRRRTRSTLHAILPLLALVWTSLPLHHCNHHVADGAKSQKATVSCSDLGRAGPDLRPSVAVDSVLVHVSFDSRWHERELGSTSNSGALRPRDDARWRPARPLHLQKSVLLI